MMPESEIRKVRFADWVLGETSNFEKLLPAILQFAVDNAGKPG